MRPNISARDSGVTLSNWNGTNVWNYPGTAINSSEAFHAASDLEESAYLTNRYLFVAIMAVMIAFIVWQMPYTVSRMWAYGWARNFRLSRTHQRVDGTPRRTRGVRSVIPMKHVPYIGLSLSETLLVVALWTAGVGIAAWCQAAFLTETSRSTLVVMCLLSLAAGLGIKSGGIGTWVVCGYTAVNFLHRWTGRLVLLLATLHVAAYLVVFQQAGITKVEMAKPENYLGAMAYGGLCLAGLVSIRSIRQRWWLFFKIGHHFGILLLLAGLNYHSGDVVPYLIAVWALLFINTALRSITSRTATASLVALPNLSSTLITIDRLQGNFTPGQHIRLRIFTRYRAVLESHPFTIASAEGQPLQLVAHAAGDWTEALYRTALQIDRIRCTVEGPYGGPLNFLFGSFKSVLLVVGGSGVSFGLGVLRGLLDGTLKGATRTRSITWVWTVRRQCAISDMAPILLEILDTFEKIRLAQPDFRLNLMLRHTVCDLAGPDADEKTIGTLVVVPPQLREFMGCGRPALSPLLAAIIRDTDDGGVGVGACGPAGMVYELGRMIQQVSTSDRQRVGGIEYHAERFSL